ncbi:bifunctional proline dehydrogenase/L-glutamate gamma-semialdehyde dehydrogenase [Schumannella sp. 10F1B-5-1]|uniref:bifunctional proline dehydrogenase/L-glutamate gamma-semialdehyde dehydrogenase n=1 Tax=Schumannella sp. 10F1B-5-1 TaxID=2590780 RepID=UPI0011322857|nr:bifunctional proline dehydrogenase/L-glutamate gamma-semialdehyde dehydrogenase [Schumannella sp. 10F1B-5-1]TPW78464.1 aldehyde dehydrogenase family protein [Schumannella sp. 10F1B-5-1]
MSSPAPQGVAPDPANPTLPSADEVVDLVHRWLDASREVATDRRSDAHAARLAGLLKDPQGLDFTLGFVDRVVRPEDLRVAGRELETLSHGIPAFLPWHLRAAISIGGAFAPVLPWPIIPIARRVLRGMVSHLVIDATPKSLDKVIGQLRTDGTRLNINLLGEAVLGETEADARLTGTIDLLGRDDVDYVSVKVSAVASQLSMWGFDETVDRVVHRLTPLYGAAVRSASPKFINLDMEEYRDLDLTIAVFTRLLEQPGMKHYEAGIVLQAYLPDSLAALQQLSAWARARVADGGAPIKVRVVKGANLAMEHVDARLHGWPLATWGSKQHTDTHYKRMLTWAMTPERTAAVKLGIAGHNLFDVAFAHLLASRRGVADRVDFEMLLGMATAQAQAVRADVGDLLLYTPVVDPAQFDSAISYLVRRLEENASPENFMSSVFDLADSEDAFAVEEERFRSALAALHRTVDAVPEPARTQDRQHPIIPTTPSAFVNEPDTDPALAANRAWGRAVLSRARESRLGVDTIAAAAVTGSQQLEELLAASRAAGRAWGRVPVADRAAQLDRIGEVLVAMRGRLVEVMVSETGKTIAEADVEVSEAIDFARWYAARARELDSIDGARHVPDTVTLAAPPWNFPVAIPCGSVLAPLAAGSAVVFKPAPQARRCGAVLAEALWEAGVPRDLVALVDLDEERFGRSLVAAPEIDRVILTGSIETAELFRSWRPALPIVAETSGKNAIVVTPSADLDLAVNDLVKSAFGHAGQKCSAASLGILVGSVATSPRFLRQLEDAVRSLVVGPGTDASTAVGPVIEPVSGKLERALTTLAPGETWLVEPRRLDEDGRLWSPGVRKGVQPGSEFHTTEYFGPVLGLMAAPSLDEAIAWQNATDYGLTAGIHSLDAREVEQWLDEVQAGNLYVNRGITGAVVRRQPFGGWKRSRVGTGAKAGGPNMLLGLGSWVADGGAAGVDAAGAGAGADAAAGAGAADSAEATAGRREKGAMTMIVEGRIAAAGAPAQRVGDEAADETAVPTPARGEQLATPIGEPVPAPTAARGAGVDDSLSLAGLDERVRAVIEGAQPALDYDSFAFVRRSALSDQAAWDAEFGGARDSARLGVERNVLRYRPTPVVIRLAEGGSLAEAVRVIAAGARARSRLVLSSAAPLPSGLRPLIAGEFPMLRVDQVVTETDAAFAARLNAEAPTARGMRIRLIAPTGTGASAGAALAAAAGGSPDVAIWSGPVTTAGRLELLPFLLEQAVSITAHRFGTPDPAMVALPL